MAVYLARSHPAQDGFKYKKNVSEIIRNRTAADSPRTISGQSTAQKTE
jgi:hypothetical protein